jgi:hypothetical protein
MMTETKASHSRGETFHAAALELSLQC